MDGGLIALNLACVEKHFHSEAADDVEAALDLYTDDIVWDAPALNGLNRQFSGKEAVAKNYRELFASMRNVRVPTTLRYQRPRGRRQHGDVRDRTHRILALGAE
jgi:ketosteroid isomerase-like protein